MKNYLAFIILSLFAVSCHQDDDAEFLQEATLKGQNDAHFENREAVEKYLQLFRTRYGCSKW